MVEGWSLRRRYSGKDIILAAVVGFVLSFTVFFFANLFPGDVIFQAQLLLGEPRMHPAVSVTAMNERFRAATVALGSFWWWTAVAITSVFVTWWLLRCFRS